MSDQGVVFGIEHIPELYELGIKNISKSHLKLLEDKIINLVGKRGLERSETLIACRLGITSRYITLQKTRQ